MKKRSKSVARKGRSPKRRSSLTARSTQERQQAQLSDALLRDLAPANIAPQAVEAALEAFGQLDAKAEEAMSRQLVRAAMAYRLRSMIKAEKFWTANKERRCLKKIRARAKQLLKLLGTSHPSVTQKPRMLELNGAIGGRLVMEFVRIDTKRHGETAAYSSGPRLLTLLATLADLVETAEHSATEGKHLSERKSNRSSKTSSSPRQDLSTDVQDKPSRGGAYRKTDAKGYLLSDIFDIYAEFRKRFPDSGPQPAFGGSLITFVRATLQISVTPGSKFLHKGKPYVGPDMLGVDLKLADPLRTTDKAIQGAYDRWSRARIKTNLL